MRIECQRPRYPASQRLVHHEVERKNPGQLITDHLALNDTGEMRLAEIGSHLGEQQRIMFRVIGDDRNVGDIALVAGAGMSHLAQLHRHQLPTNWTCGVASSRGNSTEATATTSRADLEAPPPPAGPL